MESAAQCAMCRLTVDSQESNGSNLAKGLNFGILYLVSFPYLAILVIAVLWYVKSRKNYEKLKIESRIKRRLSSLS
jgi:hypothetical protein